MTESGGKIGSVGVNYDKPLNELKANEKRRALSEDLGLMQVNDGWLPALKKYGITREKLLSDGCVNIEVGAWILAGAIAKYGQHWDAVGAYNAGCRKLSAADCQKLRLRYTKRVWQWYSRLVPVQTAEIAQYQPAPGIAVIEEETNWKTSLHTPLARYSSPT